MFDTKTTVSEFLRGALSRPDGIAAYVVSAASWLLLAVGWFLSSAESRISASVAHWTGVLVLMPFVAFASYAYLNFYQTRMPSKGKQIFNTAAIGLCGFWVIWKVLSGQ
jgi:hypothetical protein